MFAIHTELKGYRAAHSKIFAKSQFDVHVQNIQAVCGIGLQFRPGKTPPSFWISEPSTYRAPKIKLVLLRLMLTQERANKVIESCLLLRTPVKQFAPAFPPTESRDQLRIILTGSSCRSTSNKESRSAWLLG